MKIDEAQQKIVRTNQIYGVPANQFSPSPGTTLFAVSAPSRHSS
jgi:hypothetical protein